MNKIFTIAAAAATVFISSTALIPVAEAGGGVRLKFGYPLGSFVARPCGSCGSSYRGSHNSHRNSYAAQRRAAIIAKKRAAEKAARRSAIAEARRQKAAEIRRARIAAARADARRLARLNKDRQQEQDVAQADIEPAAPQTAPLPVRPEFQWSDIAIGEPNVIVAENKKVVAAPPAPAKPLDCKKFVPSAGLTITVPCQ